MVQGLQAFGSEEVRHDRSFPAEEALGSLSVDPRELRDHPVREAHENLGEVDARIQHVDPDELARSDDGLDVSVRADAIEASNGKVAQAFAVPESSSEESCDGKRLGERLAVATQ